MLKNWHVLLLVLLLVLLSISCREKRDNLEYYFSDIENKLKFEELSELRTKEGTELIKYINSTLGRRVYDDSIHKGYTYLLDSLLIDKGIIEERHKFPAIYMAIHYRRNHLEIPYDKINDRLRSYYENQYREEIRGYEKKAEAAALNFNKFEVHDTICLLFPIETNSKRIEIPMYEQKYYNNTVEWNDTLLLKGIVLEKSKEKFYFGADVYGYFFMLKVLSLNKDDDLYSVEGNLKVGGSFELYLNQYMQIIEDCPR